MVLKIEHNWYDFNWNSNKKAFDTLDHKILLDKIKCINFPDKTAK